MNSRTQSDAVTVTNMINSDGNTYEQTADKEHLPDPVVAAINQHRNIRFDRDGNVEFPYLDDKEDPELKFTAYFDDPMNDDDPYRLGKQLRNGPMYVDGKNFETPKQYVFDTYAEAKEQASNHAAALDLYEGGMVIMFVPGTTYTAEVYPEHSL